MNRTLNNNNGLPNLIMTNPEFPNAKGYSMGNAMPYFSIKMSPLNKTFIDFEFEFINNEILAQIYTLALKINKIEGNKRIYVLDENYYVKQDINIIRINNMLPKGKFEINVGFTFIKDKNDEYPTFYRVVKYVEK